MSGPSNAAGRLQDRRGRILSVLMRVGLTATAAEAAYAAGIAIREHTLRTRREYAVLVDVDSGAPVAEPVEGEVDEVDLSGHFARCLPGHRFFGIHTHPHNRHFSLRDIALLLRRYPALWAIAVIERSSGTWYVMGVAPGRPVPTAEMVRANAEAIVSEMGAEYQVPPYRDPGTARRALWHAVWSVHGPDLGLLYDRVEGRYPREAPGYDGGPAAHRRRSHRGS